MSFAAGPKGRASATGAPSHLTVRPTPARAAADALRPGTRPLGLGTKRDGVLVVPKSYRAEQPAPLVVALHGAGGDGRAMARIVEAIAEERGALVLAPDARAGSWDVIVDVFGPDVRFLDEALGWTFERAAIDPARIAVAGFSDGASYALSLGVDNGELFGHVLAFSPGFLAPEAPRGRPKIYVAHGTHDAVLPIDRCSRALVPRLRRAGYEVKYEEFDGPHTVPERITREATAFWLGARAER